MRSLKSRPDGGARASVRRFMVSEDGPTAVEYAVLLGLIVVVSFGAIGGIGVLIANVYNAINDALPS